MSEAYRKAVETEDEKMAEELIRFIDRERYTAEEYREAYLRLCGGIEGDEIADERIESLRSKMEEMTKREYPLNRLGKLVTAIEKYEDAALTFEDFVTTVPTSSKEQEVLRSIVTDGRKGRLECLVGDTSIGEIVADEVASPSARATLLQKAIEEMILRANGKPITFWFYED